MWMSNEGLPARPWFRNLYAATDRYSGYATEPWPLLREAVEDATVGDAHSEAHLSQALTTYRQLGHTLVKHLQESMPATPPSR